MNGSPSAVPARPARTAPTRSVRPRTDLGVRGRWVAWARERAGRARRGDRRHRPVRMTVLGLTSMAGVPAIGVWGSSSYTSHLHLAIHPTLERRVGGPGRTRTGDRARPVPGPTVVSQRLVPAHLRRPGTSGRPVESGSTPPRRHPWRGVPSRTRSVLEVRRVARAGALLDAGRVPDLVHRHRDELITRLVHGRRRVEVAARPAPVVQNGALVVGEIGRTAAAVRPGRPSDAAATRRGPKTGKAPTTGTTPTVDLDRLTDQVVTRLDARLTAHRERFGRAF